MSEASLWQRLRQTVQRWKRKAWHACQAKPWQVGAVALFMGILMSQIGLGVSSYMSELHNRDHIMAMPTANLATIKDLAEHNRIRKVITHEIRSGTLLSPQKKNYLEIVDDKGKSYAFERPNTSLLDEEFGKLLFTNAIKQSIVFSTGSVIVPNLLNGVVTTALFFMILIVVMVLAQKMITEVTAGHSFQPQSPDLTTMFDSVIGYWDVKKQLNVIKDQWLSPARYLEQNIHPPKGLLLTGDPGVGKTLMAKALANEIGAAFFTCTGADFAEMYVGVGPKRVRSLFRQARLAGSAVIFIDEIDALGSRSNTGYDTERQATINAMLSELDGINTNNRILVVGATNHPQLLDPALIRAGRFDHQIHIPLPDQQTREGILAHYLKGANVDQALSLPTLARRTQGYSGAQLSQWVTEAKRLAFAEAQATNTNPIITDAIMGKAQEILILGVGSNQAHPDDLKRVAVHELGHALASHLCCPDTTVDKVTIQGRGQAMGYAISIPNDDRLLRSQAALEGHLVHMLAGRAAEEILLGSVSPGAADDIEKANTLAQNMVLQWGMGATTGFVKLPKTPAPSSTFPPNVENDIRLLLDNAYTRAKTIVSANRIWMDDRRDKLLHKGVLTTEELFGGDGAIVMQVAC